MLNQKQFGCLKFLFVKHNWKFKKQNFFPNMGFYGPLEKIILKNSEKIERLGYPASGLRERVSPFCLTISADVSIFTRNFYPFPRGKPWSTRHVLVKVFNNQWRTSTAEVTIL
jgi:hypothetical protein